MIHRWRSYSKCAYKHLVVAKNSCISFHPHDVFMKIFMMDYLSLCYHYQSFLLCCQMWMYSKQLTNIGYTELGRDHIHPFKTSPETKNTSSAAWNGKTLTSICIIIRRTNKMIVFFKKNPHQIFLCCYLVIISAASVSQDFFNMF